MHGEDRIKVNTIIHGEPRVHGEKIAGLINPSFPAEPANSRIQKVRARVDTPEPRLEWHSNSNLTTNESEVATLESSI
jgi:hypothetical protein